MASALTRRRLGSASGPVRSRSRSTRCDTPAALQARPIASSCSAGASGIVTTSSSARVVFERGGRVADSAEHGNALHPATAKPRVVVEEADHQRILAPPQVVDDASPRLPGADDEHPPAAVARRAPLLGHESDEPARHDGERGGRDAVDEEDARAGSRRGPVSRRTIPNAASVAIAEATAIATRSRAVA